MLIYCICTQYWVGAPFALITASIRRGMEVISLWHCCGGMKPRFLWQWPSAHLHFLVSCFSFSSWQYPIDSLCWPVKHINTMVIYPTFGAFGSVGRCQILLENEISILKMLVSRRKHEVFQNFLANGCSDVGFQKTQWTDTSRWHCTQIITDCVNLTLDFKQLGLWAFSTLPPDSRTLVSKLNTKLALIWKEDFGPLGNSPVLLLLVQVRRLWRQL